MNVSRVAVAGLGGFAGAHHAAIRRLEVEGYCKLVATCDPDLAGQEPQTEKFSLRERGVAIYGDFEEMLVAEPRIDVVFLPTPLPLHAEQHRRAVEAGIACYLEKPPTLWWPEFLRMATVESRAGKATQVGFNFVGDPLRRAIKARIMEGEFGEVLGADLLAVWPRNAAYYERNGWAGKISVSGRQVRDSCIGNALAHNVQDLLFWCGQGSVESVGEVCAVRARLFKAHPIESFDTVFLEAELDGGRRLRIGATHAAKGAHQDRERVHCAGATITFDTWSRATIERPDGAVERLESELIGGPGPLDLNIKEYLQFVRGERARPTTTLDDCRSFVALHNLAFVSSGVVDPLEESLVERSDETGFVHVEGLERNLARFVDHGEWPTAAPSTASAASL